MSCYAEIDKLLPLFGSLPVIDVRSPREFSEGHIPGAINIPLFDNEERAKVGVRYKKAGREAAIMLGLEISGSKLSDYIKDLKKKVNDKEIIVHCWRGGMRSESLGWLFGFGGYTVKIIEGGYKSYRKYIRKCFENKANIVVIGGMTGSGKTDILKELEKLNFQVADLEGVANHKGSAFGSIGMEPQPTNEQFENNLFSVWNTLDINQLIFLEDESRSIGSVSIPDPLYMQKKESPLLFLDVPKSIRIQRLIREYVTIDKDLLVQASQRITRKIGGNNLKKVIEAVSSGDYDIAADILLTYYDKAYSKSLSHRDPDTIKHLKIEKDDPAETAKNIADYCKKHFVK